MKVVTLKQLKEERGAHKKEMQDILGLAETEKRNVTDEEAAEFDTKEIELRAMDAKIASMEKREKFRMEQLAQTGTPIGGGEKREKKEVAKRYSLLAAINAKANQRSLEGLELEMHQEAVKETRSSVGGSITGFGMPSFMLDMGQDKEKRNLVVGTDNKGGYTVPTDLSNRIIPILSPRLKVMEMGAMAMTGLTGNVDIARETARPVAVWEGENDANAKDESTFDKISLSPKRLGAYTEISKQLLLQSNNLSIDGWVRRKLSEAVAIKLDATAINGSGTAPIPRGILNTSGIGSVAIGTNGGEPLRSHLTALENAIATSDADIGTMGFLTTPGARKKLRDTKTDAGSGKFIWEEQGSSLLGYNAQISTQMPSTLTKGTLSAAAHAMIFGYWPGFMIGQWGGLDVVVNPYIKDIEGLVRVTVNSWWDMAVEHPEFFAAIVDMDVS